MAEVAGQRIAHVGATGDIYWFGAPIIEGIINSLNKVYLFIVYD